MKKVILLLTVFAFAITSCKNEKSSKEKHECTVECKHKHKSGDMHKCGEDCKKDGCKKMKGECPADCKKECCAKKGETSEMATAFYCPMKCEGDKTYSEKGSCPQCKMNLIEVENEKEENQEMHNMHDKDSVAE